MQIVSLIGDNLHKNDKAYFLEERNNNKKNIYLTSAEFAQGVVMVSFFLILYDNKYM